MGSNTITLLEYIKTLCPNKEYNEKEKEQLLQEILTLIVTKLVKVGDDQLKNTGKNSHEQFMPPNKKLPAITIKDYLCRLMKYSPCSKECFISSLLYIDRLLTECSLSINSYNIHRILITTLLISTKYLDDIFYNNEFYSQVGGVGLKEMNTLELDFLRLLKFSAYCNIDKFNEYQKEIENAKNRFSMGPSASINHQIIINKLPISSIIASPSNSPRRSASASASGTQQPNSPHNQTVPQSPCSNNNSNNTTPSSSVSTPIINVNSNNNNNGSIVPSSSSSSSSTPTNTTTVNNSNNSNGNNNSSFYQRRGSCDYERLPTSTNESQSTTFHANCVA